jgi:hypothetical protein
MRKLKNSFWFRIFTISFDVLLQILDAFPGMHVYIYIPPSHKGSSKINGKGFTSRKQIIEKFQDIE